MKAAIKSICPASSSLCAPPEHPDSCPTARKDHKAVSVGQIVQGDGFVLPPSGCDTWDLPILPEPQFPLPLKMAESIFGFTMSVQMFSAKYGFWGAVSCSHAPDFIRLQRKILVCQGEPLNVPQSYGWAMPGDCYHLPLNKTRSHVWSGRSLA